MTFELVRFGLPNTAAILALAAMPIVSPTMLSPDRPQAVEAVCALPAANCPVAVPAAVAMATTLAGTSLD